MLHHLNLARRREIWSINAANYDAQTRADLILSVNTDYNQRVIDIRSLTGEIFEYDNNPEFITGVLNTLQGEDYNLVHQAFSTLNSNNTVTSNVLTSVNTNNNTSNNNTSNNSEVD